MEKEKEKENECECAACYNEGARRVNYHLPASVLQGSGWHWQINSCSLAGLLLRCARPFRQDTATAS